MAKFSGIHHNSKWGTGVARVPLHQTTITTLQKSLKRSIKFLLHLPKKNIGFGVINTHNLSVVFGILIQVTQLEVLAQVTVHSCTLRVGDKLEFIPSYSLENTEIK
mgnify:CR=1 FL=1